MPENLIIKARFDDYGNFRRALSALKNAGFQEYEAYGPTNLDDIGPLMPSRRSIVRGVATTGALIGLTTFFYVCVATSLIYNLIVGGKPPVSNVPFVIVGYEGTILLGAMAALFSVLTLAKLSSSEPPVDHDPRLTGDTFGIDVITDEERREEVVEILRSAGATEITGGPE
ncbi:MAG: DUF3341 domain-containing protein [Armatimonadetes bacterium]|nr:DUF3341 domain-containing protein [Armatimonadota bacterium]